MHAYLIAIPAGIFILGTIIATSLAGAGAARAKEAQK
jgi:hypothetical protein